MFAKSCLLDSRVGKRSLPLFGRITIMMQLSFAFKCELKRGICLPSKPTISLLSHFPCDEDFKAHQTYCIYKTDCQGNPKMKCFRPVPAGLCGVLYMICSGCPLRYVQSRQKKLTCFRRMQHVQTTMTSPRLKTWGCPFAHLPIQTERKQHWQQLEQQQEE